MKKRVLAMMLAVMLAVSGNAPAAQAADVTQTWKAAENTAASSAGIKTKFVIRDIKGKSLGSKKIKQNKEYQLICKYDASSAKTGSLKNLRITVVHDRKKPAALKITVSSKGYKTVKKNLNLPLAGALQKSVKENQCNFALYQNAENPAVTITGADIDLGRYIIKKAKPGKSGKITLNFTFYEDIDGEY